MNITSYLDLETHIYLLHSTAKQTTHGRMELDSHTLCLVQAVDMNDNDHLDKSYPSDLHSEPDESLVLDHIYLHTRKNKKN
jgi:hypothetical protein